MVEGPLACQSYKNVAEEPPAYQSRKSVVEEPGEVYTSTTIYYRYP
jgi:hypothetical protein